MATKRIRCLCGTIYEPASFPVCPQCQTPPPTVETTPPAIEIPHPKPVMLDSDRKKRPFLYAIHSPKKIILASGLVVLLIGGWFILRPYKSYHRADKNKIVLDRKLETPSDSKVITALPNDLVATLAKAQPGTTIRLAAGTYKGGFTIDRTVHLLGDTTNGAVIIQNENSTGLAIKATDVIFENLTITADKGGDFSAVKVFAKSSLELRDCLIDTPGTRGVMLVDGGKLLAQKTTFSTRGQGVGCQLETKSLANLNECVFKDNRWGCSAFTASEGYATKCQFEANGIPTGEGSPVTVTGEDTGFSIEQSTFTNNPAGLSSDDSATLIVKGSTFKNNGVTDADKNISRGLIGVSQKGRAMINNCSFDSNRQGIALLTGGTTEINDCQFTNTGLNTKKSPIDFYCDAISASGPGTKVRVTKTTIAQSVLNGINIVEGANLEMEDVQITGSGMNGLAAGLNDKDRVEIVAVRCQFTGSQSDGISITGDTVVKVSSSTVSANENCGVYLDGEKATVVAEICEIEKNKISGVLAGFGSTAFVMDSHLIGNQFGAQAGFLKETKGSLVTLGKCTVSGSSGYGAIANNKSKMVLDNCTLSNNKKDYFQGQGGIVFQTTSGDNPGKISDNTEGQTGGRTGMEQTTPSPENSDSESANTNRERKTSSPKRKRSSTEEKSSPTEKDKANEILRNVLRYLPH